MLFRSGNGYGEGAAQKVKASDRVLMEYGKNIPEDSEASQDSGESPAAGRTGADSAANSGRKSGYSAAEGASGPFSSAFSGEAGNTSGEYGQGSRESAGTYSSSQGSRESAGTYSSSQGSRESAGTYSSSQGSPFEDYGKRFTSGSGSAGTWEQNGAGYAPEKRKKGEGMPLWTLAMLITVLVLASPVLGAVALGALGIILGGLASWFGLIFGFGVTAVMLLVIMLVLVVVGIICFFVSPWVGIALVGGGLICGSIGLLFLMLTVAMAGIATPAVCRGIAFVFRGFKRKRALAH